MIKYFNIYKGISKIFISEVMQAVLLILAIIGLFLPVNMITGEVLKETAGVYVWAIIVSVLSILALVVYLIGVIQAKREEHEFRLALYMTIATLVLQVVADVFEVQAPVVSEWLEFGCKVLELIAFESVVSGVVNTAKKLDNEKIAAIGKKMRVIVTIIWIAVIISRIFTFISSDVSTTIHAIVEIVEMVDHIFYMILLFNGIKMLRELNADAADA